LWLTKFFLCVCKFVTRSICSSAFIQPVNHLLPCMLHCILVIVALAAYSLSVVAMSLLISTLYPVPPPPKKTKWKEIGWMWWPRNWPVLMQFFGNLGIHCCHTVLLKCKGEPSLLEDVSIPIKLWESALFIFLSARRRGLSLWMDITCSP